MLCCDGNGDSWPPPEPEVCPPLDVCPPLEPCPLLDPPPDDDGDGEDGVDDGTELGLGGCGMDGDCVVVVTEQPATTSAQAAVGSRRGNVRFRISLVSPEAQRLEPSIVV